MTKIVVVGGGLLGMLSARELALAGCEVAIYERNEVGKESSWAGGGILSPLYPWRYPDAVTELARWSQERYRGFADALTMETGIDPEWTLSGLMMLGIDSAERGEALRWASHFGYNMEVLEAEGLGQLSPMIRPAGKSALWMPDVAQVRNPRLLKAVRQSLVTQGVIIQENTPVTDIALEQGRVVGTRTEHGIQAADAVLVCGGAWSGQLLEQVGVSLPVSPVRGQMLLFRASPGMLKQIVLTDSFYLIPRRDGRILAGSTLEHVGFDKQTTETAREELFNRAVDLLPALDKVEIERQWAGLRPGTNDGIPYIGAIKGHQGLYVNAGQYRNGVVTGMASARLARNVVLGEEPILAPEPYSP